ncbi:GNAT family N-acetyltransferase [Pleionea sediminis]|uniref:GNAT family N-acetyltransferase n=1 Tax=Pleionea sediminis TaxID=2569479 RepID=UPI00118493F6|nr:GNAT family N-acetyltransferase [Pleionea sediminis]
MISYQPTADLSKSAEITYKNMRSYYEHYSVDWNQSTVEELIASLKNWDILFNGTIVGAIRLAFDNSGCYVRDLQVSESYQNKGIGAAALKECERIAIHEGASQLRLRVFKISPAYRLYERNGFVVDKEEERFYYMSRQIL